MSPSVVTCEGCGKMSPVSPQAAHTPRCPRCDRSLPWLVDASDADFDSVADSAPIPVVVDVWGPWCVPSQRLGWVFEQLATALGGRAKMVRVNVENTPQLVQRFGVQGLPTLLVLHRGRALARKSGFAQAHEIRDWVEEALRCVENVPASDQSRSRRLEDDDMTATQRVRPTVGGGATPLR